jgi:hypothetical protein
VVTDSRTVLAWETLLLDPFRIVIFIRSREEESSTVDFLKADTVVLGILKVRLIRIAFVIYHR